MRFVSELLLIFCFYACFFGANAETLGGDLPLEFADEKERKHALSNFVNISYLDSKEDLKAGDIYMIDIVDTNCLIAVNYFDITQVWVWDIQGDFKYGYEIETTESPYVALGRTFWLSPDGTVLFYTGKGGSIIGLSAPEGQPLVSVYSTPTIFKKLSYVFPSRSTYKRYYSDKGKVIVTSENGEKITVVNFFNEYKKYISEKNAQELPYLIRYIILFSCFIAAAIWALRIIQDD